MEVKVYRSGIVEAPAMRGGEARSFAEADALRPADRQGRTDGIFASPSLKGVARWAHLNSGIVSYEDPFVREITVDPDTVFVYSVSAWERIRWNLGTYERYWATGHTLTEYLDTKDWKWRNDSEWELLLSADDIRSVREVPDEELLTACENSYDFHAQLANNLVARQPASRVYAD
jgi:hypothetical protein